MPFISTFMYSQTCKIEKTPQGEQLHIINPQHILKPMVIPGELSFAITFGILEFDDNKEHSLKYLFYFSENKEKVIIDSGEINIVAESNDGMMMNMDFYNVPLRKEGKYISEIYVDNKSIGTFPINVTRRG